MSQQRCSGDCDVSVVLPTYNEAENLPILIEMLDASLRRAGLCYEVIVVDDDSPDGTWKVALQLAERGFPLKVRRRVGVRGLGAAIADGIKLARCRYVVVMDADLQHPPEVVPRLVEKASSGADVVVASRYAPGGGVEGWSRARLFMSKAAGLLAHLLLPSSRSVSDPMSGFFLVRRELAARLNLEAKSWKILLEILAKAPSARVAEVPYTFRRRASGRSKLGVKAIVDYVLDLLRLSNYRILKFAAVGASGVAVNLAALEAAYVRAGLPDYLSYLASWEVSLTWNYVLHDTFTFRGARPSGLLNAVRYWLLYHLAAAASWAAYMATALSLHRLLGVDYRAAALAGIALGFIVNFAISQHKVWSDTRRT